MQNQSCFHLQSIRQQCLQNQQISRMMYQDYQSHQAQLQSLASRIQQQEQYLVSNVNQIISYQPAIDAISNLAVLYIQLKNKKELKRKLQQQSEINQIQLQERLLKIQENKRRIKSFNDKMYIHIMDDVQAIRSLVVFSERNNIKTMMGEHLSQFVYSYIHSNQRCFHNAKKSSSGIGQCTPGCEFGDLTQFMLEYKSQNIYYRFRQLWLMMEKQLHQCISSYLREFGQQFFVKSLEPNCQQEIQSLKIRQMNMKVDIQILKSQIKILCQSIGLCHSAQADGYSTNSDCVMLLKQSIQKFKSFNFYDGYNLYCQTSLSQVAYVFYQYIDEVSSSYRKQNRNKLKTQQCQERFISATINIFCHALQICLCLIEEIKQFQNQIVCLQKRMSETKDCLNLNSLQALSFNEDTNLIKPVCVSLESSSNCTNSQKDDISISIRYNRQSMIFRVLKTMHISNISSIQSSAISRASSRISSKANSRVSSRSLIKNERRSSRISLAIPDNSSNQQFNERILQFGKNKLILRKQNPHFHEEIQLKRIKLIKITSLTGVNIYFKKGYMSIEFLAIQKISSNPNLYANKVKAKRHLVRQWVKCFKAVYYQQCECIQFQQDDDSQFQPKELPRIRQRNRLINQQLIEQKECQEKQNINQNFNTFANKDQKLIFQPQFQEHPNTKRRLMLKNKSKINCLF